MTNPKSPMDTRGVIGSRHFRDGTTPSDPEPGLPLQARPSLSWEQDSSDIGGLIRPMLEALARLADLESTYLIVFDWERREQEVRFLFAVGRTQIHEGHRLSIPPHVSEEAFPGVTMSPRPLDNHLQPDSLVARRLGLKTFVSVPVITAGHRLYGMLCGASRNARDVSEPVVGIFEAFAAIVAGHLTRVQMKEAEDRATAAEAHLNSRARFLAEAEHRIKTPLTVLRGMSQTLRDRGDELSKPDRIELEQSLVRNVRVLSVELDGLLAEAGADILSRALSPVESDLGALVGEIARAFNGLDDGHQVVAETSGPLRAFADRSAVYQILGHLIDNAVKYSPGGGLITIRGTEDADSTCIEVVDHGVGLPATIDVFEAFRRGTQDQHTPGIGLGLHIVRTLVEAMHGTVTARNNPDAGATFTVTLPAGDRA